MFELLWDQFFDCLKATCWGHNRAEKAKWQRFGGSPGSVIRKVGYLVFFEGIANFRFEYMASQQVQVSVVDFLKYLSYWRTAQVCCIWTRGVLESRKDSHLFTERSLVENLVHIDEIWSFADYSNIIVVNLGLKKFLDVIVVTGLFDTEADSFEWMFHQLMVCCVSSWRWHWWAGFSFWFDFN